MGLHATTQKTALLLFVYRKGVPVYLPVYYECSESGETRQHAGARDETKGYVILHKSVSLHPLRVALPAVLIHVHGTKPFTAVVDGTCAQVRDAQ